MKIQPIEMSCRTIEQAGGTLAIEITVAGLEADQAAALASVLRPVMCEAVPMVLTKLGGVFVGLNEIGREGLS